MAHEVDDISCIGAMVRNDQPDGQAEIYDLRTRVPQPARRNEQRDGRETGAIIS